MQRRTVLIGIFLLCLLSSKSIAFSEELAPVEAEPENHQHLQLSLPPIETDRPDFTETTNAVPRGSLQVETEIGMDKDNGVRTWHLPLALFRLGIHRGTELRLVAPEYLRLRGAETANNFGDIEVGFKRELPSLPGKIDLALLEMMTLPTGADKVSANAVENDLTLLWSRDFGEKTEIGGNLTLQIHNNEGNIVTGFFPTFVVSRDLTKKWTVLMEYVGEFNDIGKKSSFLHYATTYKINPLHQLDARFGHAVSGDAPSYLFGFGYSFRVDGLF